MDVRVYYVCATPEPIFKMCVDKISCENATKGVAFSAAIHHIFHLNVTE